MKNANIITLQLYCSLTCFFGQINSRPENFTFDKTKSYYSITCFLDEKSHSNDNNNKGHKGKDKGHSIALRVFFKPNQNR